MSKRYCVQIPITGIISVEVEADDEESAINEALEKATLDDIEEWDTHRCICEGNCFHGLLNEIDIFEN